jgi:hypothetical protein
MDIAARSIDAQPVLSHRRQMRAAGDEGHIGPRLRQRRAKSSADAASANNRDPHGDFILKAVMTQR